MSASSRPAKAQADYDISCRMFNGTCVIVSISGTTARSAQLTPGVYRITTDTNCCVQQGGSTVDAVWQTSHYLAAGEIDHFYVLSGADYLSAITNGDSGKLYLTPRP